MSDLPAIVSRQSGLLLARDLNNSKFHGILNLDSLLGVLTTPIVDKDPRNNYDWKEFVGN